MNKEYLKKEKLLADIEQEANQAYGPDKYVVRSLKTIVESNFSLLESNKRVVKSIKDLQSSNTKTEKIMIWITVAGILVAIGQLLVACNI